MEILKRVGGERIAKEGERRERNRLADSCKRH